MSRPGKELPGDFEALARQYWSAWGDMLRTGAKPVEPPSMAQGWHDAIEGWSRLVHGGRTEVNTATERFNALAHGWFGQMQQVAAQFAGQDNSSADVARAWKQAMGAAGENPFPEMFRSMRGQGQQGLEQWIEDASPHLEAWRREGASWLGMPTFGFAREHQERMQRLAQAQLDYQHCDSAYNALMLKASQRAFEVFEARLVGHEEPGRQLKSARALFDLWIDAAEEAYAEIALSPEFRKVYGALVNAQMRLRGAIQKEVEQANAMLGMPTRDEVDDAHRRIAELERALRRLKNETVAPPKASTQPPAAAARKRTTKTAPKPPAKTKPAGRSPARPAKGKR